MSRLERWMTAALLAAGMSLIATAAEKAPQLIAASATSSTPDSAPVVCLLDPGCSGYWRPESKDEGINEGIYLRFEQPTAFNFIEITFAEPIGRYQKFDVFLDAQRSVAFSEARRLELAKRPIPDSWLGAGLTKQYWLENGFQSMPDTWLIEAVPYPRDSGVNDRSVYVVGLYGHDSGFDNEPLRYTAKSVFIKLQGASFDPRPVAIKSIRFFGQETYHPDNTPMALTLPVPVRAKAVASSTLEPVFAYDVSKLFDSQPDMAWSTDGKKNNGPGESVSFTFDEEQDIAGIMVWNGYQRSDIHYRANGRVRTLELAGQRLALKDVQEPQTIRLAQPLKTREFAMTIRDIYPGGSYKDVLLSELRFIDSDGRMLLPLVDTPRPQIPADLAKMADRTYASFIHQIIAFGEDFPEEHLEKHDAGHLFDFEGGFTCFVSSVRFRGNGSFVIYSDRERLKDKIVTGIMEGNWVSQPDGKLHIFGKRYAASLEEGYNFYLPRAEVDDAQTLPAPKIFQSRMEIGWFNTLSKAQQQHIVHYLLQGRTEVRRSNDPNADENGKTAETRADHSYVIVTTLRDGNDGDAVFGGKTIDDAVHNLLVGLKELNPLYLKSDVYTNLLLPNSQVGYCGSMDIYD